MRGGEFRHEIIGFPSSEKSRRSAQWCSLRNMVVSGIRFSDGSTLQQRDTATAKADTRHRSDGTAKSRALIQNTFRQLHHDPTTMKTFFIRMEFCII